MREHPSLIKVRLGGISPSVSLAGASRLAVGLMPINQDNYYQDRTHLTASMAIAFRRSKALYARRFIENVEMEPTASIKVGSYVDAIVTGEKPRYDLTPAQKRDADGFLAAFYALPIAEELLGAKRQVILTGKVGSVAVKGKPDFCLTDKTVDLKISSAAKVERWYWNCLSRGYDIQAGVYANLRKQNGEKLLPFFHLVGWAEDGMYRFKLFELPPTLVAEGWVKFKETVKEIAACREFTDPLVTWDNAEMLWKPGEVMIDEVV